jgi:hypothetical protein
MIKDWKDILYDAFKDKDDSLKDKNDVVVTEKDSDKKGKQNK